ncbi:MAG: peptide chain release factor N(5)-glutamine methyltransferase [Pseudomonadota bacterium]|nr:peptide chain release factor N(5)-glutamine methyltransferase [Pseudomonadota bacterium]
MSFSNKRYFSLSDLSRPLQECSATALLDVRYFLSEILQCPISELFSEVYLTDEQYERVQSMIERRLSYEPVAYILGHCSFWGLEFEVNQSVLIPRPDTECLIETVLDNHANEVLKVLDLGTGCGAIALALAHERRSWSVQAVDVCDKALSLAKRNAIVHEVDSSRVSFSCASWEDESFFKRCGYDVVVANPPYIDEKSFQVCRSTSLFEPKKALYSSENGLRDLRRIILLGKSVLENQGWMYLEHGFDQGMVVRSMFYDAGYSSVQTVLDYSGHDRVTFAQKKA